MEAGLLGVLRARGALATAQPVSGDLVKEAAIDVPSRLAASSRAARVSGAICQL